MFSVKQDIIEMVNIDTIQKNYPLHWLVWNNNYVELEEELSTKLVSKGIEKCHSNR